MTMKGRKTIKKPSFLIQYLVSLLLVAAFLILTGVIVRANAISSYYGQSIFWKNTGSVIRFFYITDDGGRASRGTKADNNGMRFIK